jgi:hypothetical protein
VAGHCGHHRGGARVSDCAARSDPERPAGGRAHAARQGRACNTVRPSATARAPRGRARHPGAAHHAQDCANS